MDDTYDRRAEQFFSQYQSVRFDDVHHAWLNHLPTQPGFALDVGAGSGRDALALAARGWDVLAVEPAKRLRELGQQATQGTSVQWSDDKLPELTTTRALSYRFNLILVSAVWMHLPPTQRERAFRILSNLLAPGGILVITLRHGPGDGERTFFEVNLQELEHLARNHALVALHAGRDDDRLARSDIWWESGVFRLPDDGTGALPTLRHVIVNDDKSSTYKLGLLRTLCLIADTLPGMVLRRTDDWVEIPLGVVGLYWIKLYEPLILCHNLRQAHGSSGYGFAKEAFYRLSDISPFDRRVGRRLSGDAAVTVLQAIRDACQTILKMPAHYTTWPGSNRPIFDGTPSGFKIRPLPTILDKDTLSRFGTFRVPAMLWDCFSRYACWLEPAITGEWIRLMQRWEGANDRERYYQALNLDEDRRDTRLVRQIVDSRLHQEVPVQCVWTAQRLRDNAYEVDHCLPWSRWNNNDLWNLLPTTRTANNAKSEKLPSAPLVQGAKDRILSWWDDAYIGKPFEEQFFTEAEAALPLVQSSHTLEAVFEGLLQQRLRLKVNQQLAEWAGIAQRQASE
jgi:SAM-dependent methyltransferase